ncbi:trehalose 6-phosphatase [Isoptericola sp. CG 20/1183]|uniref:Trehalose 6-phosphate phosphatase n=1 Tax=Isoptericola halotolerans TaxID=300560 RepID=A0ABX5EI80_9MICO|nr:MULTISPECIES: trehalose-phosphatase [Isoptericola]PRZ08155.1 trehalose 6-phosphatase [Isoptericola halotolerans]PRZ08952.1 trehalose 6-phosphatase [Isoptericola sp. CG 20/1183]
MSEAIAPSLATALEQLVADDGAAVLVALDFDGVLAPLVDDPTASRMTAATRAAVDRLGAHVRGDGPADAGAAAGRARLAFVSGRDLEDLAQRSVPPVGAYLVGSHGAQTGHATTAGLDAVPFELTAEQADVLAELTAALDAAVVGRDGAWVQRKPSAAVLHTRTAGPADTAAAVEAADAAAARLGLDAMHGKDVVEIAVLHTTKGEALERLRTVVAQDAGASATRVLYAGDDTTDEKAFAVLGAGDVTIKVGPGETLAAHRVADSDAVAAVLDRITDLLAV